MLKAIGGIVGYIVGKRYADSERDRKHDPSSEEKK
jgi:hypothetical protein